MRIDFRLTQNYAPSSYKFSSNSLGVKLSHAIQKQRHKSQTLFLRFTIVLRSRAVSLES